jgi:hypothetical protein
VRELANWEPDHYERVLRWPLREALLAFEQKLKREAREDYQQELMRFAIRSPWIAKSSERKPPDPPPILRD